MNTAGGPADGERVEDWTVFDPAAGPELDAERWQPLRLPPGRGEHPALDPGAEIHVGDGDIRVRVARFRTAHDTSQPIDSAKHVLMSTPVLELPAGRPATFAVDLQVHNLGGDPADYRQAMAAFHVVDLDDTRRSFSVCGTSRRVLALHEQVGPAAGSTGTPFFHMIESPYQDFDDDFERRRTCEIELDAQRRSAQWRVDGRIIYELPDTVVPARVHLGFGLWTMLPLRDARSRSRTGQGMDATWHRFRYRGARRAP